jgi:predicted acetyltransferase
MEQNKLPIFLLCLIGVISLSSLYVSSRAVDTLDKINSRINRASTEYQFVVTDTMMTVWDNNRYVGLVKIEGELDSLIIADNE